MNNEELRFYPRHPSDWKTHQIETTAMPVMEQDVPFDVKTLCGEFAADRIIHSVDCPFISNAGAKPFIENAPISREEKELIAYKNAEKLFAL